MLPDFTFIANLRTRHSRKMGDPATNTTSTTTTTTITTTTITTTTIAAWYQQPPISRENLLVIGIYLLVVGFTSTIGNCLFVAVLKRRLKALRDGQTVLLLNAACCDLAISLTGYPYSTLSSFYGGWFFGDVMCQLYGFLCFTLNEVQMNTLVVIAVFRYISVCRPQFKYLLTPALARRCLLCVWVYCLLFTAPPLLGWSRYVLEPSAVSCSTDWHDRTPAGVAYSMSLVVFCFLVQVFALVVCYTKIFTKSKSLSLRRPDPALENHRDDDRSSAGEDAGGCKYYVCLCERSLNNRVDKHVLWVNLLMVLSFITFWTPYALTSIVSIFRDDLGTFWYVFPTVFAKTSCMMNPLIYGLSHKLLYRELQLLLRAYCLCCGCHPGQAASLSELQDLRRRQAEGTYDKEGIYLGKVRVGVCACNGCVMSRRELTVLAQLHKTTNHNHNNHSSNNSGSQRTCSIALVEECPNLPPMPGLNHHMGPAISTLKPTPTDLTATGNKAAIPSTRTDTGSTDTEDRTAILASFTDIEKALTDMEKELTDIEEKTATSKPSTDIDKGFTDVEERTDTPTDIATDIEGETALPSTITDTDIPLTDLTARVEMIAIPTDSTDLTPKTEVKTAILTAITDTDIDFTDIQATEKDLSTIPTALTDTDNLPTDPTATEHWNMNRQTHTADRIYTATDSTDLGDDNAALTDKTPGHNTAEQPPTDTDGQTELQENREN
ncbi:uncharacterized protein LOC126992698 isoform X2 [Eriocheir sinensis]|uniref:uncharacterized protein LOC126992698 isoform X2 n=1 Tax=Eriocheir sinensis TaxID=95602 RepID=UPI0021C7B0E7|nr:uncharacterized protein LOC126992698 isoform X2 [Eriocheir sinensis]